jgi:hypothetical protein
LIKATAYHPHYLAQPDGYVTYYMINFALPDSATPGDFLPEFVGREGFELKPVQ